MTAHFAARAVDLVLQGLQASVLLLFNDGGPCAEHVPPMARAGLHAVVSRSFGPTTRCASLAHVSRQSTSLLHRSNRIPQGLQ